MSQKLVELLYNPSSLNSITDQSLELATNPANLNSGNGTTKISNQDIQKQFDHLIQAGLTEKETLGFLFHLKSVLLEELNPSNRVATLEELNLILATFSSRFNSSIDIFQACVQTVTFIKENVDQLPNPSGSESRKEWVQLERAIYYLAQWEGQLDYFWSATN